MTQPSPKRILLKLSGRFLASPKNPLLCLDKLSQVAQTISSAYQNHQPLELVIVTGAGNLLRGRDVDRVVSKPTAHGLGIMSTMINASALAEAIRNTGVETEFLSTIHAPQLTETFTKHKASKLLEEGKIVVIGGGTGFRYMSTDTAGVVIAGQLGCAAVFKATDVDGVYDADPQKVKGARKYDRLSFDKALTTHLEVMDQGAFALAREAKIPIIVFNFTDPTTFDRLLSGEKLGTLLN